MSYNRCHPGGSSVIAHLALLLNKPVIPLAVEVGPANERQIAFIDSSLCIGCTLCLPPCPVDAIVGGPKRMHTIDQVRCTGCALCLEPCPVDCIRMIDPPPALAGWSSEQRNEALINFDLAKARVHNSQISSECENSDPSQPPINAASFSAGTPRHLAASAALKFALKEAAKKSSS